MCRALHVLHCWGCSMLETSTRELWQDFQQALLLGSQYFWCMVVFWGFLMWTAQFRGEQQWMLGMLSRSLWIQQCWVECCSTFTLSSLTSVSSISFKFYYLSSGEKAVFEFQSWAGALSCGNKSSASPPSKHSLRSLFPLSADPSFQLSSACLLWTGVWGGWWVLLPSDSRNCPRRMRHCGIGFFSSYKLCCLGKTFGF